MVDPHRGGVHRRHRVPVARGARRPGRGGAGQEPRYVRGVAVRRRDEPGSRPGLRHLLRGADLAERVRDADHLQRLVPGQVFADAGHRGAEPAERAHQQGRDDLYVPAQAGRALSRRVGHDAGRCRVLVPPLPPPGPGRRPGVAPVEPVARGGQHARQAGQDPGHVRSGATGRVRPGQQRRVPPEAAVRAVPDDHGRVGRRDAAQVGGRAQRLGRGAATWQKYNNPKTEDRYQFDHMNGTGPFMLEQWDRQNKEVILVRNDHYWRQPTRLRRVIIRSVTELAARRLQLQQGDADLIVASLNEQSQLRGLPNTVMQTKLPQIAVQTLQFNFKINTDGNPDVGSGKLDGQGIPSDFFADIHVRRGFAYAFDYAQNLSSAYAGQGILPHGPIVQGLLGYDPSVPTYATSRDKAIAEFKEAQGGKLWDTGFKFTVPYTAGNTARQVGATILRDDVQALNPKFQLSFRPVPASALNEILFSHKGTMYFLGWFADYPDPHDFAQPFLSANGYFPVRGGYNNPEADRLIDQAVATADPAKRAAIYKQLSMIAYNDLPYLFLVQPTTYYTMRSWVHGWYYNPIFPGQYYYTLYKQ